MLLGGVVAGFEVGWEEAAELELKFSERSVSGLISPVTCNPFGAVVTGNIAIVKPLIFESLLHRLDRLIWDRLIGAH
jgi:hypothetical protein